MLRLWFTSGNGHCTVHDEDVQYFPSEPTSWMTPCHLQFTLQKNSTCGAKYGASKRSRICYNVDGCCRTFAKQIMVECKTILEDDTTKTSVASLCGKLSGLKSNFFCFRRKYFDSSFTTIKATEDTNNFEGIQSSSRCPNRMLDFFSISQGKFSRNPTHSDHTAQIYMCAWFKVGLRPQK